MATVLELRLLTADVKLADVPGLRREVELVGWTAVSGPAPGMVE